MAASFLVLHMSSSCAGASSVALRSQTLGASTPAAPVPSDHLHLQVQLSATSKLRQSTPGAFLWHGSRTGMTAVAATSRAFDSFEDPASGPDRDSDELGAGVAADNREETGLSALISSSPQCSPLQSLSQEAAMGLVLRAAGTGTGWTTGSGLEGPSCSIEGAGSDERLSDMSTGILQQSPRRRMRVAFTCNLCGHRTTRAINPHAYTDGTVFVQCGGCSVYHKLVDNLNLFHEMKGPIYKGYGNLGLGQIEPYELFNMDDISFM